MSAKRPGSWRQAWAAAFSLAALIGVAFWARERRAALRSLPPPIEPTPSASSPAPPQSAAPSTTGPAPKRASCRGLTLAQVDESLALGTSFLLRAQKPEGNFTYHYDWKSRSVPRGDNGVRQAGATWALALLHRHRPRPETAAAVERALAYFERSSHLTAEGARYVVYGDDSEGSLGTVALVALAHVDYLLAGADRPRLRAELDRYLAMIRSAQRPDGRFSESYDHDDGQPMGEPSPYYEGEALLALVKAARHLGRDDLREPVLRAAEPGYQENVARAIAREAASAQTRAYFQWSLLSYHELVESGWPGTERYAERALTLADWMIDVVGLEGKKGNLGYAYEGLAAAYELARRRGDEARTATLACALREGLLRLTEWQVGHSLASPLLAPAADDPRARGGVASREDGERLRIDVTQHQMHALLLYRRFLAPE